MTHSVAPTLVAFYKRQQVPEYNTHTMKRVPVNSSNILSIGYDKDNQLLEIEFNTKRIYRYSSVPPNVYAGLMKSPSHGKYFLDHIHGAYSYIEISD